MNNIENQCGMIKHTIDNIIHANPIFCDYIGLDKDKIEGKPLSNFVVDRDWDSLFNLFNNVKKSNEKLGQNIELKCINDNKKSVIAVSEFNTSEEVIETIFINFESENNDIKKYLKDSAIHSAPVGITIANMELEDEPLIYVNDGFLEITGYDRNNVIGQNCRFLQGEKTSKLPVKKLRKAIDERKSETVELLNYKKDGTEFWNRITISPVKNDSGKITHYLGFQEDVTEFKENEKRKKVFKQHVEKSENAMFVTDKNWVIEYVNPSFEEITKYNKEEAIGKKADIINPRNENNLIYNDIQKVLNKKETWKGELTNIKKTGERYNAKQTITPILNSMGEVVKYVIIQEDITEKMINKQILNVLNRVLRHNLRTSLNVIEGYADIIKDDSDYSQNRMAAGAISDRAKKIKKISNKITHIRNLITEKDKPKKFEFCDIRKIIQSYDNYTINLEMDDNYCDNKVKYGDLFVMVFRETINNLTTSNNGEINIYVSKFQNNIIKIELMNENSKYNKESWDIVKEGEETQLNHTDGLGLWILYWSITAMGGFVEYKQIKSGGAKFILYVPLLQD